MRKPGGIFALALLLLLAILGCDRTPPLSPLAPEAVVLAFGDSLTFGTGAPRGQAYPDVLQQLLAHRVVNAGVPGEVSTEGLKRLPTILAEYRPALLILCHGGNDLLRRHDLAGIEANLRAMIELARADGIEVVLLGVPQPGLLVRPPDFYQRIAAEYRLPYDGEILHQLLTDRALKSDTIHPNAEGYRKLAAALHELIENAQGG
ncbi:arylesterase [Desulfuromonas versatilis]|uniref:Arylesterase n=1 Tax=Desulfuromonas versatilis TaxID=2802975 RepID=A0ABM8HZR6_9BACT|nr:arylesterase [Desulfuromonas versatilis]BCR06216.1 arylesterase [Desulfuromonas versatilis]